MPFQGTHFFGATPFFNGVATRSLRSPYGADPLLSRTPSSAGNRKIYTISLWFKSFVQGDNNYLFSATNLGRYYIKLGGGQLIATLGYVSETVAGGVINSNQWYFATLVWSSPTSSGKLFLDGIEIAVATSYELHSTPTEIHLGSQNGNKSFYKGLIDDVRIYDRALSAAEVQALYNMGQ